MEKTAKRIGIAIVAVLLVALVCAGIALALPGSEAPLSSEGSVNALDTAVRSVTVDDTTYDLTDWQDANDYYNYLVGQGYTGITTQDKFKEWASANGGNSGARAALKPYTDSGAVINYSVGNNSSDSGYGAVMGMDGVFKATLDGCGAQVELIPNGEWGGTHSLEVSGSEAQNRLASGNVTMFSEMPNNVSFTGGLANLAVGATLTNLNFVMDDEKEVVSGDKGKAVYMGGLFGAMADTSLNNCSFTLASSADISGTRNLSSNSNTASDSVMAYGGITAYAYNCTVSNTSVAIDGRIWVTSQGRSGGLGVIKYGKLRCFVGGIAAITQGITMYNMTVTGSGTMYADIGNTFQTDAPQNSRAGALVGINMTATNSETTLHGWNNSGAGTTNINGVLTSYNGSVGFSATTENGKAWGEWKGILFGSTESGAVTNLYWNGASIPDGQTYCYNQTYTPVAVSASVVDNNGTASVGFANQTSSDINSLAGLQITYTAPPDTGSILWSYTDSGTSEGEVDMHSVQPYETYTVSWPRSLTASRSVTFTTGRRVKYFVRHDGTDITDRDGMDAEPVKTKQFDNTPYAVPTLQIWTVDGGTNLGEQQNASYWGIFDGEVDSSWDTAVDVTVYNVRLIDAFSSSTKYDFVDNTNRYIAYKSDNSKGASRNYRFEITAREITVSIPSPGFVYDGQVQNLTFQLANTVEGDEPQPTVTAQYFNSLGVEIDVTQVVNAGDYSVSLTGVDDKNYTITNLEEYQNYAFSIDKRPITITPRGYEGLTYNGAPKYPDADIGNAIDGNDTQIVNLNYYAASDVNRPINEDERINAGDYQMRAELFDVNNYVLDNSLLEEGNGLTFTDTSVTIDYTVGKADLQFEGSDDGTYSFVYFAQPVTTLAALNRAIGGDASPTQYYFQPVDPTNSVDVNVGESGATFTVRKDGSAAQMLDVGTYQVTVSYSSNNFNNIEASFEVGVTPRPLILNFAQDDSYTYSFQYGDAVTDYDREQPQGAQPDDELIFGTVYYKDSVAPENKLGAKPTAVGKYVASYEPTGTGLDLDVDLILGNYTVSPDANSTIEFEITKKDITVAYDGTMSFVYDGTAHSDVSVTSVEGIIASEQDRYTADKLKVTYTKDGSTADTARNAGTYTVSVAPIDAEDTDFANNYNVATPQTLTIDKAPLSLQLLDVTMDYASATGQAIPYGEGVTHNFVEGTQIFDGDDVQEDPNEWLLQIYTLNANDGSELTIDGIGTYLFSIRLNPTNSNAGNYELTLTDSEEGAKYPNAPEGVGTLTIEGTAVYHSILGTSDSGFAVMEEPTEPFAYNIDVTYRGEDIRFSFFTRTTAGSLEGLSFDSFSVAGAVESGLDETTGYPYVVVRNFGTYTATWTLAAQSRDIFFFPTEDGSTSDQNSLTVTINVGKLDAEIVPNDVSVVYGGTIEYAGFSVVGDEDGTKAAALAADNVQVTYASTTQSTADIDVYADAVTITNVTFDGALGDNYNITYSGAADLTVTPKPVTVSLTMSSGTAVYGDPLPTATSVTGEFVGEDASEMTALINEQLVYDRNAGVDKVPTLANSAIGNYTVTLADGTGKITITPKQISGVSVTSGKMPYGGSAENITPVDGVYFTGNPGFLEEDLDELGLAFRYVGQGELSGLEPGDHADALQLAITDEVMSGNYQITGYAAEGTLTVEAMIINEENVEVTLDEDTYNGFEIGYTIQISGVRVEAGEHLTISLTKDGSAVTEIKDAGEYVFAIEGVGEYYQGNVNITVTVKQADISGMDFGLNKDSATYTGSEIQVSANTSVPVALAITKDGAEAKLINAGTYTVTVTPTDPNYTGSKTFEFTIDKAPHKAPVQTELTIEVAWDSVTVTHDEFTVQLSKNGTDWVDTTMGGYDANSSYTLHVRFKEDANHSESSNTIMISGKTAERTAVEFTIAVFEEHYNRAVLTITFEETFSGKVQFSIDGGKTWKDLTVQDGKYVASGLAESAEYTLQVKIPAGDDYLESDVKSVKVKTGIDPAKYTETLAMFGETFSAGDLVNYETLKEQFNGLTEADKAGVDAAKFATITAARDAFVASVNSDIEDIQNVAAKTAGRAVAAAAAAVTAAAIALFIAKRKFI